MGALGFYNMASQLILYPLRKINPVVNTVAFPTYAKLQHDPESRSRYYAVSVKLLSLVTVPILAFLFSMLMMWYYWYSVKVGRKLLYWFR